MVIGVFEFLGDESDIVVHHGCMGRFGDFAHLDKPLVGEAGFGGCVRISLGISHLVFIFLDFLDEAGCLKVGCNLTAYIKPVHAYIHPGCFADSAVFVEYVDCVEIVFLTEHIVVHVMGRSHFQTACAKLDVDIVVLNDRNLAVYERHDNAFAAEMLVLGVIGVYAHRGVSHYGLGTCGGHNRISVLACDFIAQIV